ncbi:MAG: AEC family transporter [Candidatus Sumerlaeota bacterium]
MNIFDTVFPVFTAVLPVFFLIALGAALRRSGFLSGELVAGNNKLVYFVGLPSLLFVKMAVSRPDFTGRADMIIALAFTMCALSGLAWTVARWSRLDRRDRGTFAQAAFRSNAAFVGLPVIAFATGGSIDDISPVVILLLTTIVIINNIFAVALLLLSAGEGASGLRMAATVVVKTLLNPLILAAALGLVYAILFDHLPNPVERSLRALGTMALPLALIGIGATIQVRHIRHRARVLWCAAIIKTSVAPLLAAFFAMLLGLEEAEALPLVIFMAAPTAAASYILVDRIGGDRELAAGAVALSTLLSFLSLSLVVVLL